MATVLQPARQGANTTRATAILFGATSFLSAFLLFQVQLIICKYLLPWFGGSAAVWTTALLVFQVLLLAGYVYSHVVSVRLRPAAQTRLHLALLSLAFLLVVGLSIVWPSAITPAATWRPLSDGNPGRDVAVLIVVSVGLPFLMLSTTGPLLQSWFARLGGGVKTYKLYSVSNLGSLLGLLTFPFLFEPVFSMKVQGWLWSALFCLFAVGCAVCAWQALKSGHRGVEGASSKSDVPAQPAPGALVYALWFLLASCASALLLATTNLLCQEVTSIPLLWVLPLSLYLISFILCFDHPRWYKRALFHPLFAAGLLLTCAALILQSVLIQLVTLPVLLFFTCMVCHGELVRLKPGVQHLTSFYLAVAAGGAAGGVFVALIAPHSFSFFLEFQLTLAATVALLLVTLVLDSKSWIFRADFWLPVAIAVGALAAGLACGRWVPGVSPLLEEIRYYPIALLIGGVAGVGAFIMKGSAAPGRRGFRFVQITVVALALFSFAALYRSTLPRPGLFLSSRNFYGTLRVFHHNGSKELLHGRTTHGTQLDPPNDRFASSYFAPETGIGVLLGNHPNHKVAGGTLRLGVIGLGAGALAAYGRPGDTIRYYEINPDVVQLSSGQQPVFTYLRDSAASVSVVLGDGRLSLEREEASGQRRQFDVLVLDAFSGDAIPVHLLTKEAFDTYWQQLDQETGIIALHVTSRHIDLIPVLQGAAAYSHAAHVITINKANERAYYSRWVLMALRPELLDIPGLQPITVRYVHDIPPRLWTDDYSDIFRLIY